MGKDETLRETQKSDELETLDTLAGIGGLKSNKEGMIALTRRSNAQYTPPSTSFLKDYPPYSYEVDDATRALGTLILETLSEHRIKATSGAITVGPTVTRFEYQLTSRVSSKRLDEVLPELTMKLLPRAVTILPKKPGEKTVVVEVENAIRQVVGFKEMLPSISSDNFKVPMALGKNFRGEPVSIDVTKVPHLLIAGSTGSGKSVCINCLICSILYTKSPKDVRLILVDPTINGLSIYNGIGHLLTPVISEPKKVVKALNWLEDEMIRRYNILRPYNLRNIASYNEKIESGEVVAEKLPYIVFIMDEFAPLMDTIGREIEDKVSRLAAMSHAVGIHLVMATQRASTEILTFTLKSNIVSRIAFHVSSSLNSRIILDKKGAENLIGKGDMFFVNSYDDEELQRIQGAFLSDSEIEKIVSYVRTQGEPDQLDPELFEDRS